MTLTSEDVIADSKGELDVPLDVEFTEDADALQEWIRLLQDLVSDIHRQFQVRNDEIRVGATPDRHCEIVSWRRRAGHAQHMYERRLRVAKQALRNCNNRGPQIDMINVFASAIRTHRDACRAAGEPSDFDLQLWSSLEEVGSNAER